jgi:hypothetical protein
MYNKKSSSLIGTSISTDISNQTSTHTSHIKLTDEHHFPDTTSHGKNTTHRKTTMMTHPWNTAVPIHRTRQQNTYSTINNNIPTNKCSESENGTKLLIQRMGRNILQHERSTDKSQEIINQTMGPSINNKHYEPDSSSITTR